MTHHKSLIFYLEKIIFPSFIIGRAVYKLFNFEYDSLSGLSIWLQTYLKDLLIASFLIFSKAKSDSLNIKSAVGIILSFVPIVFLQQNKINHIAHLSVFVYSSYFFYFTFFIFSIFSLGKSFNITPTFNEVVTKGPYQIVRHPIYASYIGVISIFVIINHTWYNVVLYIFFVFGLLIRISEEEKILTKKEKKYIEYKNRTNKIFNFGLFLPVLVIGLVIIWNENKKEDIRHLSINIASPIFSLDPRVADDWSSFLIINHIYPRLISEEGNIRQNVIIKNKEILCENKQYSVLDKECKKVKIYFEIKKGIQSCLHRPYTKEIFNYEILEIAQKKNWLFPNLKLCKPLNKFDSCIIFDNHYNIDHLLRSIYLRFGWSLDNMSSGKIFGLAPNCYQAEENFPTHKGKILLPNLIVELSDSDRSDLILYGNKTNNEFYQSVTFFNPVYYYFIVSGGNNSKDTFRVAELLQKNLSYHNVIDHSASIKKIFPAETILKKKPTVILPDFLENCSSIKSDLDSKIKNIQFLCKNVTEFIDNTVKSTKKWDAFLSPLTPGIPGKHGLDLQYFSLYSKENWLGSNFPAKTKVILLGHSEGKVQVRKGRICLVTPNALGLSDFTVDDLVECND